MLYGPPLALKAATIKKMLMVKITNAINVSQRGSFVGWFSRGILEGKITIQHFLVWSIVFSVLLVLLIELVSGNIINLLYLCFPSLYLSIKLQLILI